MPSVQDVGVAFAGDQQAVMPCAETSKMSRATPVNLIEALLNKARRGSRSPFNDDRLQFMALWPHWAGFVPRLRLKRCV